MSEENNQENQNQEVETQNEDTPPENWKDFMDKFRAMETNNGALTTELKTYKNKARTEEKDKTKAITDVEELRKHYEGELEVSNSKFTALTQGIAQAKAENEVTSALAEVNANATLLGPHVAKRVKSEYQEDGSVAITVLDEKGEPMYVKGKPATVKDLVSKFREDTNYAAAFPKTGASGNGGQAPLGTTTITTKNPFSKTGWNITDQMKIQSTNPAEADRLRKEAQK